MAFIFSAAGVHAATELEPIVVRQSLYGSAGSGIVSGVVTREDIRGMPVNTPEDMLNYLGVDLQARGPYAVKSDISINASTFQQVLILVNGVPVKDTQTSHHDLDLYFNIDDVDKIELIPAAASAKYGPGGSGGAINFVLKKAGEEKNFISAAGGNHYTAEQKLGFSYSLFKAKNRFSFSNSSSGGTRYDTDFRTDTFFSSSAWENRDTSYFLDGGYNEKEFGAYDFYTPNRGYPSKEWTNTKFIDARAVLKSDRVVFEPRLNFRQHRDKFMLDITRPNLYLNHHTTNTYQAGGRLSFPFGKNDLGMGADYGEEQIISNNLGRHIRGHWDAYLDPTFELSASTTLNLTARVDSYTTFAEEFTGSLSLKHIFDEKNDVYATFGRTIRVPTFTELYYNDPTTAGDANLKPESALNFETGWGCKFSGALRGSLSFFVRSENDTIDYTKLTAADPKFIARNIAKATTYGLNAYLKWDAGKNVSYDLRYLFNNKRRNNNGQIFKYGLSHLKHMVGLGIDNKFNSGRNRVDFIMKKKPGRRDWVLVNDRASFDVKKDVELFVEVYNLFNVEFQEIAGIPEQGRLFKAGVKLSW
jgi:iron complex outermembrane receptor protein